MSREQKVTVSVPLTGSLEAFDALFEAATKRDNGMFVYLAGAIDAVSPSVAGGWRDQFITNAPPEWSCFSPLGAFRSGTQHKRTNRNSLKIAHINRTAIVSCDVLFAYLLVQPMFGTVREIEYARIHEKPVVVLVENIKDSVEFHDLHQVLSMESAYEEIERVASIRR